MRRLMRFAAWLGVLAAAGCGKSSKLPDVATVKGTVTLDGEPIGNALVAFFPEGKTEGNLGSGMTAPDGKYSIRMGQGTEGLVPGTYRVTVSRLLRKDGTPPPPDVPPIETDAEETLPPSYSDLEKTTLRVTVDPNGQTADLPLKSGKKKS